MVLTNKTPADWTQAGVFRGGTLLRRIDAQGHERLDYDYDGPPPPPLHNEIYIADLSDGSTRKLTSDGQGYINPIWSRVSHAVRPKDGRT
jgi:hypothetical protein